MFMKRIWVETMLDISIRQIGLIAIVLECHWHWRLRHINKRHEVRKMAHVTLFQRCILPNLKVIINNSEAIMSRLSATFAVRAHCCSELSNQMQSFSELVALCRLCLRIATWDSSDNYSLLWGSAKIIIQNRSDAFFIQLQALQTGFLVASSNNQQIRGINKHWNPKWRKLRGLKVIKVKLPNYHEKPGEVTPEEKKARLKERGVKPMRPWNERPMYLSTVWP